MNASFPPQSTPGAQIVVLLCVSSSRPSAHPDHFRRRIPLAGYGLALPNHPSMRAPRLHTPRAFLHPGAWPGPDRMGSVDCRLMSVSPPRVHARAPLFYVGRRRRNDG